MDEDRLHEFLGLERPGKSSSQQEEQTSVDEIPAAAETVSEEIQTTVAVATEIQYATATT